MTIELNNFNNDNEEINIEQDKTTQENNTDRSYSWNPFVSKGRMSRKAYFLNMLVINLLQKVTEIPSETFGLPVVFDIFICFLGLVCIVCSIFVIKKRYYDITLNNKKSWTMAMICFLTITITLMISEKLALIIALLFGIQLLCTRRKEDRNVC